MKKTLFIVLFLSVLISSVSATQFSEKFLLDSTICEEDGELSVQEECTEASGQAFIRMHKSTSGIDTLNIRMKISISEYEEDKRFYAFLLDNSSEKYHYLGEFKMMKSGKGSLEFSAREFNINNYNRIIVTKENNVDSDSEIGKTILSGDISSLHKPIMMKAKLRGVYEIPKAITPASGSGMFYVDTKNNSIEYHIAYKKLKGEEISAHIHGFSGVNSNSPVIFDLDLGEHKTGVLFYDEEQEAEILAGKTYVNIHSTSFPNGEIRGQIVLG